MAREIAYINGGEIYKEQTYFSGAAFDPEEKFNYIPLPKETDPISPFRKHQQGLVKTYCTTLDMRIWTNGEASGENLTGFDLCPDVTLWWGKGMVDDSNYDLYFRVDDKDQLQNIADYYSLPYPINTDLETLLNDKPLISMYRNIHNECFVLGAVKYIDDAPALLKFYCFYKDEGERVIVQKGRSLYNGGIVYEEGELSLSHTPDDIARKVISNMITGETVEWEGKTENRDPLFSFNAIISDGNTTKVKSFESSKQYRTLIAHYTTGDDFSTYDLCPDVNIWMGKSTCEDEIELYFYAEDSTMLEQVATYYNLPEPCDAATKARLDSDPEEFRLRHQDINQIGERSVPVVVASVVFTDNVATMFKLYEITRWNE